MVNRTEEGKLELTIHRRFNKGVIQYGLIEEGDRILVGLSGGKDSLALLELLAERSKQLKPHFSVIATYVKMTNIAYRSDSNYLKDFCTKAGVEFIPYETSFDAGTDQRKSPCFLCSWNRRKALFTIAQEHKCNKIALGHHMDDILATLLMNMSFQGTFSTMPPKLMMKKFNMTIIRPLCLVAENDLKRWALIKGYQKQIKNCPYEKDSHRSDMKNILEQIDTLSPQARYNLWSSMNNIQKELLPEEQAEI